MRAQTSTALSTPLRSISHSNCSTRPRLSGSGTSGSYGQYSQACVCESMIISRRTLPSIRKTPIHRSAGDRAGDGPEAGDHIVTQDQADEERQRGPVGADAAVPQRDHLAEPADKELAPEQVQLEA